MVPALMPSTTPPKSAMASRRRTSWKKRFWARVGRRENDKVGGFHQLRRHLRVPVVQDAPQGHREAGVLKGREHLPGEAVREGEVVRVRADEEPPGRPGHDLLQLRDKAVGGVQPGVSCPTAGLLVKNAIIAKLPF